MTASLIGMQATSGTRLQGLDHLRQSIVDILTTPIGSRVMRMDYGSELFGLIDGPVNSAGTVKLYAATAKALAKWEKRFKLSRVLLTGITEDGKAELALEGEYLPEGKSVLMEGISI